VIGYSRAALATALVGLSFALLGAGTAPSTLPPGATILNPGNAEYTGYAIALLPDGRAWAIDATGRAHGQVSYALSQAFFADLAAAGPLAQLPIRQCTAPSGNTSPAQLGVFVAWHNQHTPNLQCGIDQRSDRLLADATAIARALYVQAYRARPVVIGTGHSDAYRYSYSPPRSNAAPSYANSSAGSNYGGSPSSNGGVEYGSQYAAGNYGAYSSYGGGNYGGGSYGGGCCGTSTFGPTFDSTINSNNGISFGANGFGANPMSGLNSGTFSAGAFGTSFSNGFGNNSFGSANPFSTNIGTGGDFGRSSTFGSGAAFSNGLPSSNVPSGSSPSSGLPSSSLGSTNPTH